VKIEVLCAATKEAYDKYLLTKSCSLFYYSSKYKDFLKDLLRCEDKYLLAVDGGRIRGILPLMYSGRDKGRIYNSLPYYGSNGGIISDDSEAYRELAGAYNEMALCETTLSSTIISNPFARQDTTDITHNFQDYRIGQFSSLSFQGKSGDGLVGHVGASARRNIKKAINEGVTVEIDPTQLDRLRQIHQTNIRDIGGIPKCDMFFTLVPRYFTPSQDYNLYVAKKDGVMVAGLLVFFFNQTVEYFIPAIDRRHSSSQPLALILKTAMSDAVQRGFHWWNWGGTWASQVGVYRFKRKWAAMDQKYQYFTQLNDTSILSWNPNRVLETFPGFFVVPFSALGGLHE